MHKYAISCFCMIVVQRGTTVLCWGKVQNKDCVKNFLRINAVQLNICVQKFAKIFKLTSITLFSGI